MNIYANVQDQKVLPNKVGNALGQRCNIDLCRQRIVLVLRAGEIPEYAEDEWQLHLQQSSGYVDGNDSLSRILAKNITLRSGTGGQRRLPSKHIAHKAWVQNQTHLLCNHGTLRCENQQPSW